MRGGKMGRWGTIDDANRAQKEHGTGVDGG
jgi:hypothetical protein